MVLHLDRYADQLDGVREKQIMMVLKDCVLNLYIGRQLCLYVGSDAGTWTKIDGQVDQVRLLRE